MSTTTTAIATLRIILTFRVTGTVVECYQQAAKSRDISYRSLDTRIPSVDCYGFFIDLVLLSSNMSITIFSWQKLNSPALVLIYKEIFLDPKFMPNNFHPVRILIIGNPFLYLSQLKRNASVLPCCLSLIINLGALIKTLQYYCNAGCSETYYGYGKFSCLYSINVHAFTCLSFAVGVNSSRHLQS